MTGLMTIFLVIGGLGFLFLLILLIVGDIFDAIGFDLSLDTSHDFGIFDSRVIAIFLTAFGGFGAIGISLGWGALGGSLFGLLGGFIFGAIVFYFGKLLYSQQSSSSVAAEDLIGRTAQVIGKIDKIVMIDQGNGNGDGNSNQSGINRFAQTAPTVIFSLLQQLQAMGLSVPEVMAQLGINQDGKVIEAEKNDGSKQNGSSQKIVETTKSVQSEREVKPITEE